MFIDEQTLFKDYENAILKRFDEFDENSPNTYKFSELKDKEVNGLPIMSRYINNELYQTFLPPSQTLILGSTRSGKTTSFILPSIFSLAERKNKSSFIATDPKGEIYRATANRLKKNGYTVKVLNFRNVIKSECWNPLTTIYRRYVKGLTVSSCVKTTVKDDKTVYELFGETYDSVKKLNQAIFSFTTKYIEEAFVLIDEFSTSTIFIDSKDPFWDFAARQLLSAILHGMLEDINLSLGEKSPITEINFNMIMVASIFYSIQGYKKEYFSSRGQNSVAKQLGSIVTGAAAVTINSIELTFINKIHFLLLADIARVTSLNTFDVEEFTSDKPLAFFIIYKDEDETSYRLISLLVSKIYQRLIEIASNEPNLKFNKPIYFLLDELGNFPAISGFTSLITAGGSRNLWVYGALQSYWQLQTKYPLDYQTIIDNLQTHIFLGTNNIESKEAFSRECGQKTIISPLSALNGKGKNIDYFDLTTVPLISVSNLTKIQNGVAYVNSTYLPYVLETKLERSYLIKEFEEEIADINKYVRASINYKSNK